MISVEIIGVKNGWYVLNFVEKYFNEDIKVLLSYDASRITEAASKTNLLTTSYW